jgi:hypothetical protein
MLILHYRCPADVSLRIQTVPSSDRNFGCVADGAGLGCIKAGSGEARCLEMVNFVWVECSKIAYMRALKAPQHNLEMCRGVTV